MPVPPAFWVLPSCLRSVSVLKFETLGRWRGVFRRGEGLIRSRGVTPAHLPILSLLAALILVLSISVLLLSFVLFISIVLVLLILVV